MVIECGDVLSETRELNEDPIFSENTKIKYFVQFSGYCMGVILILV